MNEELIKEMVKVKNKREKAEIELGKLLAFEDMFSDLVYKFFSQKFKNTNELIHVYYKGGQIVVYRCCLLGDNKKYTIDFTLKNLKEIANVDSVEEFDEKLKNFKCEE